MYHKESDEAEFSGPETRIGRLEYVSTMAVELRRLAELAGAPMLVSILDLAKKEADERAIVAKRMSKFNS